MARRILRMLILFVLVIAFNGSGFGRVSAASLSQGDLPPGIQEGQSEPVSRVELPSEPDLDLEPKADRTVGPGCTYATIAAAIAAANPGDRLLLAGNVTFYESLLITKNLTLEGGYAGCSSASSARTNIDGSDLVRVIDINTASVSLLNLNIRKGYDIFEGGGIRVGYSIPGTVSLENVTVSQNTATWGGGIWIGASSTLLTESVSILENHATSVGGGLRLFGGSATLNNTSLNDNEADLSGGGISVSSDSGGTIIPDVNLSNVVMQYNVAGADGGAVQITAGSLEFAGSWDLRWNHADGNGGAVAILSTGDVDFRAGGASYLAVNSAGGSGGGIYLDNNREIIIHANYGYRINFNTNSAGANGGGGYADAGGYFDVYGDVQMTSNYSAGNGGLFYLSGSRIWIDDFFTTRPQVWVNHAVNGGSIYALNSVVDLDGVDMGGTNNGSYTTTGSGGAIYLEGSNLDAANCHFRNNRAALDGGAIYALNSTLNIGAQFSTPLDPSDPNHMEPKATGCNSLTACSAFYNNTADSDVNLSGVGGAIYNAGGSLTLNSTHLYANQALRGGAIFQTNIASTAQIQNSLIYDNQVGSPFGAGIRNEGGSFLVTHVTFTENSGGAAFSSSVDTTTVTNSIAVGNELGFVGSYSMATTCNLDQEGLIGIDPLSSPFYDLLPFRLRADSEAVDACTTGLNWDLSNLARPIGVRYDMGAYEGGYQSIFMPVVVR